MSAPELQSGQMCRILVTSLAIVVNIYLYALMDTTIRDPRTLRPGCRESSLKMSTGQSKG